MTTIYRATTGEEGEKKSPKDTRRVPKNIPYVVDNLWAWARPGGYTDRRFCAYGSRTPEEAEKFGNGITYRIEFLGDHAICQLQGYADAKKHPDVDRKTGSDDKRPVKEILFEQLGGYGWSKEAAELRAEAGLLYMPALSIEEVSDILASCLTATERSKLKQEIDFWDDVEVIESDEDFVDTGEIFFEYEGGYRLQPIDE